MVRKLSKEDVLSIPELVKDMTVGQIATKFGVTMRTVSYQIKHLRDSGHEVVLARGPRKMKLHA